MPSGLWNMQGGENPGIIPTGSFEEMSTAKQFRHSQQFGVFLDGQPWTKQKISLLAELEIIRKASELNNKEFDKFTEGERNLIEWLLWNEDELNG